MPRLIIVDDEQGVRDMLADYLRASEPRFEVAGCFSNGELAWEFMRREEVDLVITDIRMPRLSGLELAQKIAQSSMNCVVCIVSGYSEFEYARQAIECGVAFFLLKPIQLRELSDALHRMERKLLEQRASALLEKQFSDDDTEMFFADLLLDRIPAGEMAERAKALNLPYSHTEANGFFLRVTAQSAQRDGQRVYDAQRLFTALVNVLRMHWQNSLIHPVSHQGDAYWFIVLHGPRGRAYDLAPVRETLRDVLGVAAEFSIRDRFASLSQPPRLMRLLARGGVKTGAERDPARFDQAIARAKEYIAQHYGEDITRYDVASAVYMNSAYFSRYFKAKTGENFNDYLTAYRMRKAILLMVTPKRLSEISRLVGYCNYRYFARVFQGYTTYSPSDYRRKVIRSEGSFDEIED
jgi:two-component system response regulator YesN